MASLLGINTRGVTARGDLNYRRRPAAMIIVAWLVVLVFHLAFFLWPDLAW